MKKFRLFGLTGLMILSMLLAGCKYSDNYLARHPSTLKPVLVACQEMGPKASSNTQCVSAMNIYNQMVKLSQQLANNPEGFGQTVLHDQMQLAMLKEQIDQKDQSGSAQLSKLKSQYHSLKQLISIKIAVIEQMEGI